MNHIVYLSVRACRRLGADIAQHQAVAMACHSDTTRLHYMASPKQESCASGKAHKRLDLSSPYLGTRKVESRKVSRTRSNAMLMVS